MDNANGLYGSLAIIGDEFPPDENQTNIYELSVAKSKLKLLDVKQKAWRKSGLGVAFRRKSNIVKYLEKTRYRIFLLKQDTRFMKEFLELPSLLSTRLLLSRSLKPNQYYFTRI